MSMSAEVYFSVLMLVIRPGTWEDALAIFRELRRYTYLSCVFHVPCRKYHASSSKVFLSVSQADQGQGNKHTTQYRDQTEMAFCLCIPMIKSRRTTYKVRPHLISKHPSVHNGRPNHPLRYAQQTRYQRMVAQHVEDEVRRNHPHFFTNTVHRQSECNLQIRTEHQGYPLQNRVGGVPGH